MASFGAGVWILVVTLAAIAAFLFWGLKQKNKRPVWLAGLVLFILFGAVYYTWDDVRFREKVQITFDEKISFSGQIISNPVLKSSSQEFKLELNQPFSGDVLVKTDRYPQFSYGDKLKVQGTIKQPYSESYGRYLAKERISGVITFAETERLSSGHGSKIKNFLFGVKKKMIASFQQLLPPEESTLLAGLTLGERGEFSEDFKEAMAKSGTTHLVALSGYNITIIVSTVMALFAWFLIRRRTAFFFTILVILGFVLMTGAEASVVRAAIMGIMVMVAGEIGRFFDFRNAIILAGLVMVLENPKVLVYDVGFELSFLALLGIIYLKPAIIRFFRVTEKPGFLSWRENFFTTAGAQLMVVPLLISNFGSFSLTSLAANVVVLEFIPVTMGLGFTMAAFSFFSYYLSLALGLLLEVLLKFEIIAIEFFARFSIPFSPDVSILAFLVYYVLIIVFIYYVNRGLNFRRICLTK